MVTKQGWAQSALPDPPLPMPIPLAAGRFYDASTFNLTPLGLGVAVAFLCLTPHWIPKDIAVVNLGVELTSAGTGAGAFLGIYDSIWLWDKAVGGYEQFPWPDYLVCDTAGIALTGGAAYYNGVVTYRNGYKIVPAGVVWLAYGPYTTSTVASVRVHNNANYGSWLGGGYPSSANSALWSAAFGVIRVATWDGVNMARLPRRFQDASMSANALTTQASTAPRVLMET